MTEAAVLIAMSVEYVDSYHNGNLDKMKFLAGYVFAFSGILFV
jgi:hypothetical protein